jgi:hypothetical protein
MAALLLGAYATYLSSGEHGRAKSHLVSGLYRSELLDKEVSVVALSALTHTEDFRNLVGGRVTVEAVAESPFHVRVTTGLNSEEKLLAAHKRAIHLLSVETQEQAMGEVKSSLQYLDDVRRKTAELKQDRLADETRISLSRETGQKAILNSKESQRVLFLREEIKTVSSYLEGTEELAKTVRVRLDRESLSAAEKRVRSQQQEMRRLAKLFHPTSEAVQAQRVSLEQAQEDLEAVEKQLAEVYLRALRLELETLDDKASSQIRENLSAAKQEQTSATEDSLGISSSSWLDERQKELEARAEVVRTAATLKLEGKLTFSEHRDSPYSWIVTCWGGSLVLFLLAIFSSADSSTRRIVPSDSERRESAPQATNTTQVRLEIPLVRSETNPDRMAQFFDEICQEMTSTLKRSPRRILVLGDSPVDSRLAFSIRLANSWARQVDRVKLVDFDFRLKSLSERLGRNELPGVSELLVHGGPVDEFFSSISGTRVQFAPAGKLSGLTPTVESNQLSQILGSGPNEVTVIDASSDSPLHLLTGQVDGVLWVTQGRQSVSRGEQERRVLMRLRDAGLPIWGVSVGTTEIFPLL